MDVNKVRITWRGIGGEVDSATVTELNDASVANALINMVSGGRVLRNGPAYSHR